MPFSIKRPLHNSAYLGLIRAVYSVKNPKTDIEQGVDKFAQTSCDSTALIVMVNNWQTLEGGRLVSAYKSNKKLKAFKSALFSMA